jgi:tRNA-dependent cyclodipeptide synthase
MSKYKIIVRSPGWRAFTACTLGVSVMSPNWQNDYFASILAFAAANFQTIRIDLTDALYRHNFMAQGFLPVEAAARADAIGAAWLERHQHMIEASTVTPDVIRWSQWHRHSDYDTVLEAVTRAYDTSPMFRDAVESDVSEFCRRQGRQATASGCRHSRDYLLEEVAVFTLEARALPSLKLYPGDEPMCVNIVRRGLVPEAPRGLEREQYAKVKFHTRGYQANQAPGPQSPSVSLAERSVHASPFRLILS